MYNPRIPFQKRLRYCKHQSILPMKKDIQQKQVLDIFSQKLDANFEQYCQMHKLESNRAHFITYLYDQNLISNSAVKKYAILATFEDLFKQNEGRKTQTVNLLADRFNLTPRSIWNVLQKRKNY